MDIQTQIKTLQEFIQKHHYGELLELMRKGDKAIKIDFSLLVKFSPEIADLLLDKPEEVIKGFEIAIEQFDIPNPVKNFTARITNLPKTQKILLRNIRSEHLGKLLWIEGVVRQKSDVRPQVTAARFECPSCGNIIPVIQVDSQFKEPTRCGCGRKGKFNLLSKELIDAQNLKLEELSEHIDGSSQAKRMNVFLKNDLVSPLNEKRTNPGTPIRVVGIVKEIPIITRSGSKSVTFDLLIEANSITPMEQDYTDIKISKEDEIRFKEISKDPELMKKLVKSVAPSIYGHEAIKEALILQLTGGVLKERGGGSRSRGDIHIMLIGDPGSGKSQLIKRIEKVAPKAKYVSGKGTSGAGLTASVVKDEFLSDWALEAGALVLANKGMCCIDELDKMSAEDRSAMHEALEQQTVTISKANIQATLRSETTVLAAANPKFGRFDPFSPIAEQINLPPALISRFDLIFPVRDIPQEEQDDKLASFILKTHQVGTPEDIPYETQEIRKYIAFSKMKFFPVLTDSAIDELKKYYLTMRKNSTSKSIPITPRQLEALVRLSEANAKIRLSDKVTRADAKKAVELEHYCMKLIAFDEETGEFDVDRVSSDVPASKRNKIILIKEIINDLEDKLGKTIPLEDLEEIAKEKGMNEDEITDSIEKLKRSGDIYEPKRGFIQKI